MNEYKVTIAVPIYGVEAYIKRCAISLFEQSYENIEYVFVNDCTKDNSIQVLKQAIEEYPNRSSHVKIINHDMNRGLGAARNTAIEHATGEFIMWVDSDDYVHKDIVAKCCHAQRLKNADIVSCGCYVLSKKKSKQLHINSYDTPMDFSLALFQRKAHGAVWGRLVRKQLYFDHNIRVKEGVNMGEDFQVMPKLAYFSNSVSFIDEPLYYYDCTSVSSYTNLYSKSKFLQDWESFDIVKCFFAQFNHKYDNEINLAELKVIITDFVFSARYKNIDYYYYESRMRLLKINRRYWRLVPVSERLLLILSCNRMIMSIYANIATSVKHFVEKFYYKR